MTIMEKIIELVRKYPMLYNRSHKDYKNIRKKEKIWSKIGKELGESGKEIKKKWKNLRDTYAKYIKNAKTKSGSTVINTKRWIWADQMETFRPFFNFAKTSSDISDIYPINNNSDESTAETNMELEPVEYVEIFEHFKTKNGFVSTNLQDIDNPHKPSMNDIQLQTSGFPHTSNIAPRITSSPVRKRKHSLKPSTSIKDVIKYFENKKILEYDAVDQIFLAHARTIKDFSAKRQIETKMKVAQIIMEQELLHLEELSSSHHTVPESVDSFTNISSVDSISIVSVDSSNDFVASPL